MPCSTGTTWAGPGCTLSRSAASRSITACFHAQSRRGPARGERLAEVDAALNRLRVYLRLAHHWRWLSDGQYAHVSAMVAEIGRLLRGWIRATGNPQRSGAPGP